MEIVRDSSKLDPEFPMCIRNVTVYDDGSGDAVFHWHPFLEITCVESGSGVYYVNGVSYRMKAGSLIIFNGTETHGWKVEEGRMDLLVMTFAEELIASPGVPMDEEYLKPFVAREEGFSNRIDASAGCAPQIHELMKEALRESNLREAGYRLMMKAIVMRILAMLVRHYDFRASLEPDREFHTVPVRMYKRLEPALYYINAGYTGSVTLEEAARRACMSPNYFSTCFRKTLGKSFSRYVTELRLHRARELTETTDMSMTEIAGECGFRNMSNFYRLWKKYGGMQR
ncbi:MAG: AraC family transcriptional regulator [Bilifractor sp.]|jgi:AraC-like DNA-binding protein|nr:AraC family transcriptional regulator [Lachnospiraceae bacterium]